MAISWRLAYPIATADTNYRVWVERAIAPSGAVPVT